MLEERIAQIAEKVGVPGQAGNGENSSHLEDEELSTSEDEDASSAVQARASLEPHRRRRLMPGASPPTHLQLLFNNALIGPANEEAGKESAPTTSRSRKTERDMIAARKRLQALVPSRRDVSVIASYAPPWMNIYHGIFQPVRFARGAIELHEDWAQYAAPAAAQPTAVAAFLLTLAITVRQLPGREAEMGLEGLRDVGRFVRDVVVAVRECIVQNDEIAATVEGIEATVLYIRL